MSLSVGIVGLPNAGKSTLFNALLSREIAQVAEYPFTTIEPNTGVVEVPDERLVELARVLKIEKMVPAAIKFVDIAGLVKGAYKGEGLGNKFLSHIREVDVILHVVREFGNPKIIHVVGEVNPVNDITVVNLELILADFELVVERLRKEKEGTRKEVLEKLKKTLGEGKMAAELLLTEKEKEASGDLNLLTAKPVIFVVNTDENRLAGRRKEELTAVVKNSEVIFLSARLELDLLKLDQEERKEYWEVLGVNGSCLDRLIKMAYKTLGLMTFFTVKGGKLVQAWSMRKETTVLEAAALVHTDMALGFIKAEVINGYDLVRIGSWQEARERGKVEVVGKDYQVKDGEVMEFKFN